jgi:hypothetical protein
MRRRLVSRGWRGQRRTAQVQSPQLFEQQKGREPQSHLIGGHPMGGGAPRIQNPGSFGSSNYWLKNLAPNSEIVGSVAGIQLLIGKAKDYVATRISYELNLSGPRVTVSTACSTSLVAVHLACQSLLDFHCDIALAGSVSIQIPRLARDIFTKGAALGLRMGIAVIGSGRRS